MNDDDTAGWAYHEELLHQRWLAEKFNHFEQEKMMSLTVKDNGGDFLPPPEGLHIARCYALIDLGVQVNQTFGNSSPKVLIGWELMDAMMEDGKPFIQMQRYTASLSEKSNLRGLLEAWRGRSFSPEELKGFKLKNILSATCYITTKHKVNQQTNKRWSEVISICRLPQGVTCPQPFNKPIFFDLDEYTEESYLSVPEGIRKKINISGITGAHAQQQAQTYQQHQQFQTPPQQQTPAPNQQPQAGFDPDQDVPF